MMYVSGIPSSQITEVWDNCKKYIEMGNNKSKQEMTIDDIYERLLKAEMQLWLVFDEDAKIKSVLTTEVVIYPRMKTCRIVTLGGRELDIWVEQFLDVLEEWAIENDCVAMETACRRGFIKKLEKFGYEHTYTILTKELQTLH
tara:strand:- start:435 stop:863 length:429 start_codon:yes stop_codon:yes gene_type:complete